MLIITQYNFTVGTWVSNQDVNIYMSYWTSDLSTAQAIKVANLLSHAVDSILDDPQRQVSTLGEGLGNKFESTISTVEEAAGVSLLMEDSKNLIWPALNTEQQALQKLWSDVLGADIQCVGLHADFIQLGGDSLLTMKLITAAHAAGLELRLVDALSHTIFSEMFGCLRRLEAPSRTIKSTSETSSEPESWSFMEDSSESESTRESLSPALNKPSSILFVLNSGSFPTLYLEDYDPKQHNANTSRAERLSAAADFEDLLATSLVQQSMLTSQARSAAYYSFRVIWNFTFSVDSRSVLDTWQGMVDSHQILRTMFVKSTTGTELYRQVVMRNVRAKTESMDGDDEAVAIKRLITRPRIDCRSSQPAHALVVYKTSNGKTICSLDINHALVDAVSLSLLLKELVARCSASSAPVLASSPYRRLLSYIETQPHVESSDYWHRYLAGTTRCRFPTADFEHPERLQRSSIPFTRDVELRHFSQLSGVTPSTIFRSAWALLLSKWLSKPDICFGYVLSGRDAPIEGAQEIVGPFLNMLPCCINIGQSCSVSGLLNTVQADFLQSLPHQFWSRTQVENAMAPASAMFNTLFNFRYNIMSGSGAGAGDDGYEILWSEDPMDYDLVLAINNQQGKFEVELSYWDGRVSGEIASKVINSYVGYVYAMIDQRSLGFESVSGVAW